MKRVGLGRPGRVLDLLARGVGAGVGDVVVHGRREQERVVGDGRDLVAQAQEVDRADVGAVDVHGALGDVVQTRQQRHERGLPGAHRADQRHGLAGVDLEVDVAERRMARAVERQADSAQLHVAVAGRERRCATRGS